MLMSLKDLEESHSMDFKDYKNRDWTKEPSYIWMRKDKNAPEECYRVVSIYPTIVLEKGKWLAPIPVSDRRNKNINLLNKYPEYSDVYLPDGQKFLSVLRNRKENSDIVAWKGNITEIWNISNILKYNKNYILNQQWKCRYCGAINQGTNRCRGVYKGQLPRGGPPKANDNVLAEYEYFLTKTTSCPPIIYPFNNEQYLGWHDVTYRNNFEKKFQNNYHECNAVRCVDFSHMNQSDQILSFPRTQWSDWSKTFITNSEQFYLPGAMLGHQTTSSECICPKCRQELHSYPYVVLNEIRLKTEHSWWLIELLYWLKVDIYNKKMQKLSEKESLKRYLYLKNEILKLHKLNIKDFVYYFDDGTKQSIPFNNILKILWDWIQDKNKYYNRFDRKKIPPGFNLKNIVNLKF